MTTLDTPRASMNSVAWALSVVLVIFFLICAALALFWPTSAFGQGWVALFATTPDGAIASYVGGIVGSIATAWLVTGVFMGVYNRLLSRSQVQPPGNRAGTNRRFTALVWARVILHREFSHQNIWRRGKIRLDHGSRGGTLWFKRSNVYERDSYAARRLGAGGGWAGSAFPAQSR